MDARICRQMGEGLDLLAARDRAGTLPDMVVVALGTNGSVTTRTSGARCGSLGRGRLLGLVTPRETGGARAPTSAPIRAAGRRWQRR